MSLGSGGCFSYPPLSWVSGFAATVDLGRHANRHIEVVHDVKAQADLAAGALLALLVGASPVVAAGSGADFGACVAHHATDRGRFQPRTQFRQAPGFRWLAGGLPHA